MLLKYFHNQQSTVKTEVLAGLTVAVALVPEAVAFSLIAGLSPLVGLYSAFIIGLITSVMGGRPGMISGATGAIAVVIVSLVISHGDRKSTRLNSSHVAISYAVFCLKKKIIAQRAI